jgi:hypothetical protein
LGNGMKASVQVVTNTSDSGPGRRCSSSMT